MLLSFIHKRSQKQHKENNTHDRIANRIVQKWIKVQEQCATFLQCQSEKLSFKTKKFLLAMFLLLSGVCCVYLIVDNVASDKNKHLSIAPIKVPEHVAKAGDENTKASAIVSEAEYERIHRFQLFMDSLSKSPSGKRIYDSILNKSPDLMNSIMLIQKMSKSKNLQKNY